MTVRRRKWDGPRVRALRRHLGLTQKRLAGRLGIRQQTVSEWETGMYQPRGSSETLLSMVAEDSGFSYGSQRDGVTGSARESGA
ncbi:MAG: helix-turn-helix domain-containing protein [Chloroflexota bacterium]